MNARDLAMLSATKVHRTIHSLSGGRLLDNMDGMPVLEVTTTGAKSGQQRTVMLTIPIRHEGNPVVVASRGGDARHPSWYHNMVAHPEVRVKQSGQAQTMRARVASGAERERLWPQITEAKGRYGDYQSKTTRQIPLVILEPA